MNVEPDPAQVGELWRLSAAELADGYATGRMLPSDALAALLDHIRFVEPALNLFSHLDKNGAEAAAAESDRRWRSGNPRGPLDGVPVTIKDNLNVAGMPTAWGTTLFKDRIAPQDETPVARLRAAGCVILGKTNIPELALGNGNTSTPAFGVTRNPWDPSLTPGSSTGGGAAAVAAGVAPIALGTDSGGSIRRPASYCGVLGLKTSTGMVGRRHGLPPTTFGMGTVGALTRTVNDLALVLAAIQGPESGDRASEALAARQSAEPAGPARLRIRYVPSFGNEIVEPAIVEGCAMAASRMSALNHQVVETGVPFDVVRLRRAIPVLRNAGLASVMRGIDWRGHLSERFTGLLESGAQLSAIDYVDALVAMREFYGEVVEAFAGFDLIMTPAAAAMPWAAAEGGPSSHSPFTGFANAAGLPAIAIPCGFGRGGVPIGFQLVGPLGADWLLVAVARAYERCYPWADIWPPLKQSPPMA